MRLFPTPWLRFVLVAASATTQACAGAAGSLQTQSDDASASQALSASGSSPVAALGNNQFCLDIGGNSYNNGAPVQIYHCNGSEAQKWTFNNGLLQASGNRCLNVVDGKTDNNVRMQIWQCNSGDKNMIFALNGETIRWPVNGKCLDVVNGNFSDGNPVQMYDCFTNSTNQRWDVSGNSQAAPTVLTSGSTNNGSSGALDGFVANAKKIPWNSWTAQNQTQGLVNNEQEAYITDGSTISYDGDTLVITARPNYNGWGWVSGKLLAPVLGQQRGYLEASINTPSAQGTWPAFWLMPKDNNPTWPQGGEVDIMEQVNGQNQITVSTHWGASPSQTVNTDPRLQMSQTSGQYHRYGVAWDQSHLAFYVDGVKVPGSNYQFANGSPFAQHMTDYTPILNLAMGGDWPKYAPDSVGPQVMRVQYVVKSTETPGDF